jgi:hypothetical protein
MFNLGIMKQYIGIKFVYLPTRIFLLQRHYTYKVLSRFGMENNNVVSTSMEEGLKLQLYMGNK